MRKPRVHTGVLAFLLGGGLAPASPWLLFGGLLAYEGGGEYLARTDLDSARWRAAAAVDRAGAVRIPMIDDLLRRQGLRGMPRGEVVALLGEPDDTPYFREWDLVYRLGPELGPSGIDSEWVVLRLGGDGRVAEHRVLAD